MVCPWPARARLAGDTIRAVRILERGWGTKFIAPGRPWDGTYRRAPEEADPPAVGAKVWEHYDPNWRQFTCTTFALILIEFESRLPLVGGLFARRIVGDLFVNNIAGKTLRRMKELAERSGVGELEYRT